MKHDNSASKRVVEKLGYKYYDEKRIDYDGTMTDFHYYQLHKTEIINVRERLG